MDFVKKYIMIILIMAWCFLIYSFSSQNGKESSSLSRGVSKKILVLIKKVDPQEKINLYKFNKKLRKTAHFLNYLGFGIIVFFSLKNQPLNRAIFFSLLISLLVAAVDEYYQSFVPGREGRGKDVIIDFSGTSLGIFFCYIKIKFYEFKK